MNMNKLFSSGYLNRQQLMVILALTLPPLAGLLAVALPHDAERSNLGMFFTGASVVIIWMLYDLLAIWLVKKRPYHLAQNKTRIMMVYFTGLAVCVFAGKALVSHLVV